MLITKFLSKLKGGDNKEILTSSLFAMLFKVTGMISGYIFIIVSIHYTSIEQYGVFSLCLALIQCAAILARLGFDSSIVKYVSIYSAKLEDASLMKEVYLKGFFLISVAGLFLSIGIYIASPFMAKFIFHQESLTIPFQISVLGIFPSIYLYYNSGALRGLKRILHYSGLVNANFVSSILSLIVIVFLFDTKYPLELSYAVGSLIICVLSFYWWIKHSRIGESGNTNTITATELLNTSLPMLSAGALYIINGWTDTLFLGVFSTQQSVGIFNVLLKIAAITQTVLFAVTSISAPQFARLNGLENKEQLQNLVQKSTKLIMWATLPVLIIVLIGYAPFVNLFNVGFKPYDYLWAFIFLCIGQAINSFCGPASHLLLMTGHQKSNGRIIFISFVTSIVLNMSLIPLYGLHGAAFANMSALIVRNILFVVYTNRSLHINTIYNPFADVSKWRKEIQSKSE